MRRRGEPPADLTDREREVVAAILTEGTMPRAAGRLGLSPHTIHSHMGRIRHRLGAHGLLDVARRLGWLRIPRDR